jgi:phage tail-like protein
MAIFRDDPYGSFNYRVTISPQSGDDIRGGFSDVTGLSSETAHAEYREGTDPTNRPRKVLTTYKVGDVTLKRGMLGSLDIFQWVDKARRGDPAARATVMIELRTEANKDTVASWKLENARPTKWTGPTLAAKGGTDVAMEELVLICEDIHFE